MEENQEQVEKVCTIEDIKKLVKSKITSFEDVDVNNLEVLYKLVDVYKDLENVDYWNLKKEEIKNEIQRL